MSTWLRNCTFNKALQNKSFFFLRLWQSHITFCILYEWDKRYTQQEMWHQFTSKRHQLVVSWKASSISIQKFLIKNVKDVFHKGSSNCMSNLNKMTVPDRSAFGGGTQPRVFPPAHLGLPSEFHMDSGFPVVKGGLDHSPFLDTHTRLWPPSSCLRFLVFCCRATIPGLTTTP